MISFIARGEPGDAFASRDAFLEACHGSPVFAGICHALASAGLVPDQKKQRPKSGVRPIPWITPVIGSGCLEERGGSGRRRIEALPSLLREATSLADTRIQETPLGELVGGFVASLVADRLEPRAARDPGPRRPPQGAGDEEPGDLTIDEQSIEAAAVSTLLTMLYDSARAVTPTALARSGRDTVRLDPSAYGATLLTSGVLEPTVERINALLPRLSRRSPVELALAKVLGQVLTGLREAPPTLAQVDVRLVTELTWCRLSEGTEIYPGWSDLLLELAAKSSEVAMDRRGQALHHFKDVRAPQEILAASHRPGPGSPWVTSGSAERRSFYDALARLLRAEADRRAGHDDVREGFWEPPVTSAFVTSFDLELEMALWRDGKGPFVVAAPFQLLSGEGDDARPVALYWLARVVRPGRKADPGGLAQLQGSAEDWFRLSGERTAGGLHRGTTKLGDLPWVVRLTGCPLLEVPALDDASGRSKLGADLVGFAGLGDDIQEPLALIHSVLLDEFTAMQVTALEHFVHNPTNEVKDELRFGLPVDLSAPPVGDYAAGRFWLVLGLQVSESSVRYRVASQITTLDFANPRPRSKRVGLAVNRNIDRGEQLLFRSQGFDVAVEDIQSFEEDLDHYVAHLAAPTVLVATGGCQLPKHPPPSKATRPGRKRAPR